MNEKEKKQTRFIEHFVYFNSIIYYYYCADHMRIVNDESKCWAY